MKKQIIPSKTTRPIKGPSPKVPTSPPKTTRPLPNGPTLKKYTKG